MKRGSNDLKHRSNVGRLDWLLELLVLVGVSLLAVLGELVDVLLLVDVSVQVSLVDDVGVEGEGSLEARRKGREEEMERSVRVEDWGEREQDDKKRKGEEVKKRGGYVLWE